MDSTTPTEHNIKLELNPTPGALDIITISAGTGNGWHFSPEVLQSSLSL